MHITILDGYTTNDGDLSWESLKALGDLTVYDRTPPEALLDRARDAEILLTNKTPLSAETIKQLPQLRYIGLLATGYNVVDVEAAHERGIPVCNAAGYGTLSVAQHTFALLLALTNSVAEHAASTQQGHWSANPDWTYRLTPLVELAGRKLGVVGWGAIGQAVGKIGAALGMEVLTHTRSPEKVKAAQAVDQETLFTQADVVSLHCPLTPENERMVNATLLRKMKATAYLINTARGPLIDEPALADALAAGQLAGAALDVLSQEPPSAENPLLGAPRCLLTPHLAWGTRAARERLIGIAAANIRAFQAGKPQNVVNGVG